MRTGKDQFVDVQPVQVGEQALFIFRRQVANLIELLLHCISPFLL